MVIDLAKKSLLGKARERPDLVPHVIEKVPKRGRVSPPFGKCAAQLDMPVADGL